MIFRSAPDQLPIGRANSFGYKSGFGPAEIAREKDPESYRNLVRMRGFEPARTWMIGNSPKSDINPALDVGLNAVCVPHAHTWVLENQEIREAAGKLVRVERFSDLRHWF